MNTQDLKAVTEQLLHKAKQYDNLHREPRVSPFSSQLFHTSDKHVLPCVKELETNIAHFIEMDSETRHDPQTQYLAEQVENQITALYRLLMKPMVSSKNPKAYGTQAKYRQHLEWLSQLQQKLYSEIDRLSQCPANQVKAIESQIQTLQIRIARCQAATDKLAEQLHKEQ